jgi:hypothetical protein
MSYRAIQHGELTRTLPCEDSLCHVSLVSGHFFGVVFVCRILFSFSGLADST